MRTEPQRVVAGRSGSQRVVADLPDQPHATSNRRTSNIESSSKPQGDPRDVFAFSRCDDSGSPPHMHTQKRYAAALAAIVYCTARLYMFDVFMFVLFSVFNPFVVCRGDSFGVCCFGSPRPLHFRISVHQSCNCQCLCRLWRWLRPFNKAEEACRKEGHLRLNGCSCSCYGFC